MNWLDIVVLIVIGYSTFAGLGRGFARAIVGVVAMVLGIVFGFSFYGWVASHLFAGMASRELAKLFGFLIVFGAFLLLGGIFGRILARLFKTIGLGWLDHLLGGGLGFVRGLIAVSVLVTVTLAFEPDSINRAKTLPYIIGASDALAAITPKDVKDKFREAQENVKETVVHETGLMSLLIFDLDGTLIDSKLDLAHSVNAARRYMGLEPISHDLVSTYIGNGAPLLIRRALGAAATDEQVAKALDYFIRYYTEHCLDNTSLYPGVKVALDQLHAREGVRMAVLTNKPVRISNHIINGLGCGEHFFRVYGGNSFDRKKPDPVGIEKLLSESGVAREAAVMVGDSAVDVRTARNANIRACGVTYGFQPETFVGEPPDFVVDDLEQLAEMVL